MTYDHQIWQAGISRVVESNETNQTSTADVITSRPRDKIKLFYLHYQSVYGHQTWLDGHMTWSFIKWSCNITWQTKTVMFPLPQCLCQSNLALTLRISYSCYSLMSPLTRCLWPPNSTGRDVTYHEWIPSINSHDPLLMWPQVTN